MLCMRIYASAWRSEYHCGVQYITLFFIGCISVSSLRGFLRNMRKVKQPAY